MTEPLDAADSAVPARGRDEVSAGDGDDLGGDPACWLNRVCPQCGRLNGRPLPFVCEACGASVAEGGAVGG